MSEDERGRLGHYVEEVAAAGGVRAAAVLAAFRAVPREAYTPPGPWTIEAIDGSYYLTEDAAISRILHAVGVCLDIKRGLNSGNPARVGRLLEAVDIRPGETVFHVGAGLGYFSAIMAELVGENGRVTAAEIDADLLAQARQNLAGLQNVVVVGEAQAVTLSAVDVIFSSAGLSTIPQHWIDMLRPGGRMLLPLTGAFDSGHIFLFRKTDDAAWLAARQCTFMRFYPCVGMRDVADMQALDQALADPRVEAVRWLRLDPHARDANCWLHREDYCLCLER